MIKPNNIQKRYNTKAGFIYVLQPINFEVDARESVALMGPSGAARTTLLNVTGCWMVTGKGSTCWTAR